MLTFETVNELSLKVTCSGSDTLFVKAGALLPEITQETKIIVLKKYCSVHNKVLRKLPMAH